MNPIPKLTLGIWPTPLQELTNMEDPLDNGQRLFFKREDLCGIGFGGNKVRKLEYLLADALAKGCDCIITGGGSRSNQSVAAAACANRAGLEAHIVLPETTGAVLRGILKQLGAAVYFAEKGKEDTIPRVIRQTAEFLKIKGHRPYIIPSGASTVHGVLGYVDAMEELFRQADDGGIYIDHVVCCGGTGNTYTGVLLGTKLYHPATRATAVSIGRRFCQKKTICKMAGEAGQLLGVDAKITEEDVHVHFCCGAGASSHSPKGRTAMQKIAAREGILLDPLFTGKAFAGLLELQKTGVFREGQTIVFLHTGGMATLLSGLTDKKEVLP